MAANAKAVLALSALSVALSSAGFANSFADSLRLSGSSYKVLLEAAREKDNAGFHSEAALIAQFVKQGADSQKYQDTLAWASFWLGNAFFGKTNYVSARVNYEEAIQLADLLSDSVLLAKSFSRYGMLMLFMEKLEEADASLEQALTIASTINDTNILRDCYEHLGASKYLQDKSEAALAYQFKALELAEATGNKVWQASSHQNLGLVYYDLHQWKEAEGFYQKALEQRTALGDDKYILENLQNLTYLYLDSGALDAARTTLLRYQTHLKSTSGIILSDPNQAQFMTDYSDLLDSARVAQARERELYWQTEADEQNQRFYALLTVCLLLLAGLAYLVKRQSRQHGQLATLSAKLAALETLPAQRTASAEGRQQLQRVTKALEPIYGQNDGRWMRSYLCHCCDRSLKETADLVGVSESAVSRHLTKCRERLGSDNLQAHALSIGLFDLSDLELEQLFGMKPPRRQK